jgi:hypothetical protein
MTNLQEKFKDLKDGYEVYKVFAGACTTNNMETIRYLTKSEEHKNLVHPHLGTGFTNACFAGNLEVVKYLLTESGLTINVPISYGILGDNDGLISAARNGHLSVIQYLLTSPELQKHANINAQDDKALCVAVMNKHFNVINYLLHSPSLQQHANIDKSFLGAIKNGNIVIIEAFYSQFPDLPIYSNTDKLFQAAYENQRLEMLKHLIFDKNMPKTEKIEQIIKDNPNPQVEQWFELREVNEGLNQNLPINNTTNKKTKV